MSRARPRAGPAGRLSRLGFALALGLALGLALWLGAAGPAGAEARFFTLASTTATDDSGLFPYLLPRFMAQTGIEVRVVAVGSGQAARLARHGDADVLLLNHRPTENALLAEGTASARHDVMYDDFVVLGPAEDPAGVAGATTAAEAFRRIGRAGALFLSRGDDGGTHYKERALWRIAGIDAAAASGDWYRAGGAGMGATLNTAAALGAYVLSDRASWLGYAARRGDAAPSATAPSATASADMASADTASSDTEVNQRPGGLALLFEGDPTLFNQYAVLLVDPARHPHARTTEGETFIVWLTSGEGQHAIAAFAIDGRQAYMPNAAPAGR